MVIFVSDNQSWVDAGPATARRGPCSNGPSSSSATRRRVWSASTFSRTATSQAQERTDVLNVGGFSDEVFETVAAFAAGRLSDGHWVAEIEAVEV